MDRATHSERRFSASWGKGRRALLAGVLAITLAGRAASQETIAMPCSDDTFVIDTEPGLPHGSLPHLTVGHTEGPGAPPARSEGLVFFKLDPAPAGPPRGAIIERALVRLWQTDEEGGASGVVAYLNLGPWSEPGATWGDRPPVFLEAPAGQGSLNARRGHLDIDVTQTVRDWLSGARANYGLSLRTAPGGVRSFASRESTDPAPVLEVTYRLPPRGYNPGGWIQTHGWNFLGPLLNPLGAGGGGVESLGRNWIEPCVIEDPAFNPRAGAAHNGRTLPLIDFVGGAAAAGFDLGGLAAVPLWLTVEYLESAAGLALPHGTFPREDRVSFDSAEGTGIANIINRLVIPQVPGAHPLPVDNVLYVATTYVRNNGPAMLVEILSGSDDSYQVFVNDHSVLTKSTARPYGGGYRQEVTPVVLPAGVSKIAVLVWEGGGEHNFGLGLAVPRLDPGPVTFVPGEVTPLTDGDDQIEFLGPGDGGEAGQAQYTAAVVVEPGSDPGPAPIAILGPSRPGAGDDDDLLAVRLCLEGVLEGADPRSPWLAPSDIEGDCLRLAVDTPPVGAFERSRVVGRSDEGGACYEGEEVEPCGGPNDTDFLGGEEYVSSAATGRDIWCDGDLFEFAYMRLAGDFDVAIEVLDKSHSTGEGRWGKFGLMARWTLDCDSRFIMLQDHLPLIEADDTNRCARRFSHPSSAVTTALTAMCMAEEPVYQPGMMPWHARFQRLKREGDTVLAYLSDDERIGAASDPCDQVYWGTPVCVDNQADCRFPSGVAPACSSCTGVACNPPECMYVGFANSEHGSGGCASQSVRFRLLEQGLLVRGGLDSRHKEAPS